jgi:hypothetical protein
MDYTPRLKNLLKMRRALLSLSEAVINLTDEDVETLLPFTPPDIDYLNISAGFISSIVRKRIVFSHQAALPAEQAVLFCALCEDDAPHQMFVAKGGPRYKCIKCGLVGERL